MDDRTRKLNESSRASWDKKAAFWDELHGAEGNQFHRKLISPAVERLLALQPGERVLDIACGTGVLARRMAELGAKVTAVDFSPALLERARERGQTSGEPIIYTSAEATDEEALAAIGEGQFDAAVCTMALMDMPLITPLYRAVRRLLVDKGRFVFAVPHPAFNSYPPILGLERQVLPTETVIRSTVTIGCYLNVPPIATMGATDDPAPHYFYHRPLHQLLGEAFDAGFVLDGMAEPSYAPEDAEPQRPLAWSNFQQFPPVLVGRLIPKGG